MMPLKKFAQDNSIGYRTAYRYWQNGLLKGKKLASGTIMISGWASEESESANENTKKCILVRKKTHGLLDKVIEAAKAEGHSKLEIKEWGGRIYDSNPLLGELLDADYNHFFIITRQDAFGINGDVIAKLLELSGIKITILVEEPKVRYESVINELLNAMSKMLRATVGMASYKKEISELINKVL